MNDNQIFLADCFDIMRNLPDNSIDAIITSPPYDNLRDYKKNDWSQIVWEKIINELYRVLKKNSVCVWIVGDQVINGSETTTSFKQTLFAMSVGFLLHDTMIYKKKGVVYPETTRYYQSFEYMFVWAKGKPKTVNLICDHKNNCVGKKLFGVNRQKDGSIKKQPGYGNHVIPEFSIRNNIWEYSVGFGHSYTERYLSKHPAIMPEQLAKDHLITWTNESDIVLDPFAGSFTTAIACLETGRRYICIEKEEE